MRTDKTNDAPVERMLAGRVPRGAMLKNVLPQRLIQLRGQRGISQKKLARDSGVACSTISVIEAGQAKNLTLATLLKLCGVFLVTPDYMLGINANHTLARAFAQSMINLKGDGCTLCGRMLKVGEPHTQGECIMYATEAGRSDEYLAGVWGLGIKVIPVILQDEYRRRNDVA